MATLLLASAADRTAAATAVCTSAWNTLGRAQLKAGQRKDAIASFEKAVELNPKSTWAQNNLGLALIYDGKYEDAVVTLAAAMGSDPLHQS